MAGFNGELYFNKNIINKNEIIFQKNHYRDDFIEIKQRIKNFIKINYFLNMIIKYFC